MLDKCLPHHTPERLPPLLLQAVDRGMLQLPGGNGPDLRAVLATAQEIAGERWGAL